MSLLQTSNFWLVLVLILVPGSGVLLFIWYVMTRWGRALDKAKGTKSVSLGVSSLPEGANVLTIKPRSTRRYDQHRLSADPMPLAMDTPSISHQCNSENSYSSSSDSSSSSFD